MFRSSKVFVEEFRKRHLFTFNFICEKDVGQQLFQQTYIFWFNFVAWMSHIVVTVLSCNASLSWVDPGVSEVHLVLIRPALVVNEIIVRVAVIVATETTTSMVLDGPWRVYIGRVMPVVKEVAIWEKQRFKVSKMSIKLFKSNCLCYVPPMPLTCMKSPILLMVS